MNKQMPSKDLGKLSERQKWILRLLYAPQGHNAKTSVAGKTRLMKGLFLVDRKLKEKFGTLETGFNFGPYKYGPFDQGVYSALDALIHDQLVDIVPTGRYEADEIVLTSEGKEVAKEVFEELDQDIQNEVSWIKGKHVQKSLSQLLSFVYNQYPEMAENSELDIS